MRNLLEEFRGNHGLRSPTILGVREHVFTGRLDVLSLGLSRLLTGCCSSFQFTCYLCYLLIICLNMQCFLFGLVHVQPRD